MPNLLEQPHTLPRLVAVVGGRRRPAPFDTNATATAAASRRRPAPPIARASSPRRPGDTPTRRP